MEYSGNITVEFIPSDSIASLNKIGSAPCDNPRPLQFTCADGSH